MQLCPSGTFSDGGDGSCRECPPGYSCYNETVGQVPVACSPGFYSYGGLSECLPCPVGESMRIDNTAGVNMYVSLLSLFRNLQ